MALILMKIGVKKMKQKINNIMNLMDSIEYGFKDENGENIINANPQKWDDEFYKFYYLQTPDELLKSKCGVCWDQVELERKLFQDNNIKFKTYFIYIVDNDMLPSHTFLTYENNNKHYWFEHSCAAYKGIHEYESELELLLDVKKTFINEYSYVSENCFLYIYEYQKPKKHITCDEFYKYIETQKLIKTNKPLYFYHLVNKDVDMNKGIISLQYMYDNKMYDLFDKNVEKYKDRILNDWNIEKYKGKSNLVREEYIDALNIFRGKYGTNYIYFFRYPPYKKLGNKINEIAKYKDIYRVNINDEEIQKLITDIFYGYDMSNSDNNLLDKKWYETISQKEYFSKYDDNLSMNFSTLNHISISFKNGNCPLDFLEKVDWR